METTRCPGRNSRVVYRQLSDGEAVLLHLDTGAYHGLNHTGVALWELLDGVRTLAEIVGAFARTVEDGPPELEEMVTSFVEQLHERDLVT